MSLLWFHFVFLLAVMIAADVFGVWALLEYQTAGDWRLVAAGALSLALGLAVAAYALWLGRKSERAHVS